MKNTIYTKIYDSPPINKSEILRYAGVRGESSETDSLLEKCLEECKDIFSYKVCYTEFNVSVSESEIDLGFASVKSKDLEKNLCGCSEIILFAATVGAGIDRLIAKNSLICPAKALLFQAIGSERIESLCNKFNEEIKDEKKKLGYVSVPRFSPGYGDLDIGIQKQVTEILDCQRKIGITLNDSMLMFPSKSVTAIIGLKKLY